MSDARDTPPCSCELAGFCERHRRNKSKHQHKLCQKREDYRAYWDANANALPYLPSLVTQVANVSKGAAKWIAAGRPVRSDEEVAKLFDQCQSNVCGLYRPKEDGVGRCAGCGCWLKRNGGLMNKLKWATEDCPKGFFHALPLAPAPPVD